MNKTVQVTVSSNPNKETNDKHMIRVTGTVKKRVPVHLIDIAGKQVFKVERPEYSSLDQEHPHRDIKCEIDVIEKKYYSSNAAVDRIMSRKFKELVGIYLRRQMSKIKGQE